MKFTNCALQSLVVVASIRSSLAFGSSALRRQVVKRAAAGSNSFSSSTGTGSRILMSKKDQSFPTWSFDKPCTGMEWNTVVPATLTATSDMKYQDSDLIIVGIYAPTTTTDEEDDSEEGTEPPPVVLTGVAKEIDESLGGILSEVINDNAKSFKAGANAGSMTPTVRVVNPGGKVMSQDGQNCSSPRLHLSFFCLAHSPGAPAV